MSGILVMLTAGPGTLRAREQLDLALGCLACDLELSVLFSGDAVSLLDGSRPRIEADPAPQARAYAALRAYGCERIAVCADSLRRRHLTEQSLTLDVQCLDPQQQSSWLHAAGQVLGD